MAEEEEASRDLCPRIRDGHLQRPRRGGTIVHHPGLGFEVRTTDYHVEIILKQLLGGECSGVRTRGGLNSSRSLPRTPNFSLPV